MHALVVDDSEVTRLMLRYILKSLGFEVIEAGDGREGLAQLKRSGDTDLVLVDLFMPEMDGLEFVREVRRQPSYDHIRLMMVTCANEMESVSTALEAGANEYLMKPFSQEMVLEKLQLLGIGRC